MNTVAFAMTPTANPDEVVNYSFYVINASTGIGMDVLLRIVEEEIPVVSGDEVRTRKEILYTKRGECPCCPTDLYALVRVSCDGLCSEDWKRVEGLYEVRILPDYHHKAEKCVVIVNKLYAAPVSVGSADRLPKKDYAAARAKENEVKTVANTKRRKPRPV